MRGKESQNELYESLNDSDLQRLFTKINKTESCWFWTGGKQMKFRTKLGTKTVRQILYSGLLSANHVVVPMCGSDVCVRPEHLEQIPRGKHATPRKPLHRGKPYPVAEGYPNSPIGCKTIYELTDKQVKNLFKKVVKDSECWSWTGQTIHTGRGKLKLHGIEHTAPRVFYAYHHKVDPGPWYVLHTCDNPNCVNPEHLKLGTAQDNTDDMIAKGRFKPSRGNTRVMDDKEIMKVILDTSIPVVLAADYAGVSRHRIWELRKKHGVGTSHRGRKPGDWAE